MRQADVYLYDRQAGRLTEDETGYTFQYDAEYLKGASIYLREKIELQQEKEYERKYITASMTGEQDAERLI